jgi:hypothetical protein
MTTPLNLSTADDSGYEPFPGGLQEVMVTGIKDIAIKEDTEGKYPPGTPGYSFEFTVQGGEYEGRKVWNNYWLPSQEWINTLPVDSDDKGAATQKKANFAVGRFVRALIALGYAEKDVKGGKFKFDKDDTINRRATANIGVQPERDGYDARNIIRDLKPVQNLQESGIL